VGLAALEKMFVCLLNKDPSDQARSVQNHGLHSPTEVLITLELFFRQEPRRQFWELLHSPCQRGEIDDSPLQGWLGCHLQDTAGHLPLAGTLASGELSKTVPANLIEM